jgi:hypothetical protein
MNPEAAGAIAVAAGVGVYATLRTIIKFWQEHFGDRPHYRRHPNLGERVEPHTRRARDLLVADPDGDADVVGTEAERWLRDQPPPAAEPPAG